MNKVEFRLPVLALSSRESKRLSKEEIRKLLDYYGDLDLEIPSDGFPKQASGVFFLYFMPSSSALAGIYHEHCFKLVEVGRSFSESILDEGSISGSRVHYCQRRYTEFSIHANKLGSYKVYCEFAEIGW